MFFLLFLIFASTCYGISNILIYSTGPFHIFKVWREWIDRKNSTLGELFSCMMCLPFWVGASLSAINLFIFTGIVFTPYNLIFAGVLSKTYIDIIAIIFFDACISSGIVWIIHNIEEFFER